MSHGQRLFCRIMLPFVAVGLATISALPALLALGLWTWIEINEYLPDFDDYEEEEDDSEDA